jgi:O-antigen ligase
MNDKNNAIFVQKKISEWDEGIYIILILIIVTIPLIFYRYSIPTFTPVKELSLQLLVLLGLTMWALKVITIGNPVKAYWHLNSLNKPILLFLLFGCLSLIWTINIYNSILALPLFIAGPILFYIITNSIQKKEKIERLLLLIIIIGSCMGAYGILQYLGIDFEFWGGNIGRNKVMGLFGNVNYFAEYLILPLSLTIGLILSKNKAFNQIFLITALIVMSTALFLTFTRGSYLAIAISIPVMLLFYYRGAVSEGHKKYYKKIILYFVLFAITAFAIIYIPHPLNREDSTLGKLRSRVTIESLTSGSSVLRRVATWKFTWMMIEDYPLLGSGLGTYDYHTLKYQADFFNKDNNRDIYPHGFAAQAHNEYLQLWSELGIIGLLIFLWLIISYYSNILKYLCTMKDEEKAITIGLAGGVTSVLVDALFGFPLQLAASISLFWMFIGLSICQMNIVIESEKNINSIEKNNNDKKDELFKDVQRKKGICGQKVARIFAYSIVIVLMVVCVIFLVRPFIAGVYWYHGNQKLIGEKHNEAIKIYEKGLKWNPWQGKMYYDIGVVLLNKGLNTPAIEYFKKSAKYIDHPFLPRNIANCYLNKKELQEAIPYLEQAIKYQPEKENVLPLQLQLGNIYLTTKDYKNSERIFADAIENNPDSAEAYYGIAGAYLKQGKKEQGIESLEKVIELAPDSKLAGYAKTTLTKIKLEDSE